MIKHLVAFAICLTFASCLPPLSLQANPIYHPKCWKPQRMVQPAVFRDCRNVIERISNLRPPDAQDDVLKFSPDPAQRPDIKIPVIWAYKDNKCNVGLQFDSVDRKGYDLTTLNDIKGAALAIAIQCVIHPPSLGGVALVGYRKHLVVNVLYAAPPDPPDPPTKGENRTLSDV